MRSNTKSFGRDRSHPERGEDGLLGRLDRLGFGGLTDREIGILKAVPRQDADDARAALDADLDESRHRRRRGGLAKDPLFTSEQAVGGKDLVVGDRADRAARLRCGGESPRPRGGITDPDRRRDGLWVLDRMPEYERRRAGCLETKHARASGRVARFEIFAVALPVGAYVPGISNRHALNVWSVAERVNDLECSGLLTFNPVRVD